MANPALFIKGGHWLCPDIFASCRSYGTNGNACINLPDKRLDHFTALVDFGNNSVGLKLMISPHCGSSPVEGRSTVECFIGQHNALPLLIEASNNNTARIRFIVTRIRTH